MRLEILLIILSLTILLGCKNDPDAFWGTFKIEPNADESYFAERNPATKVERLTQIGDIKENLICARPEEYKKLVKFYTDNCFKGNQ